MACHPSRELIEPMHSFFYNAKFATVGFFVFSLLGTLHADDIGTERPVLTAKFTPNIKDNYIGLLVKNTGKAPFHLSPTAIRVTLSAPPSKQKREDGYIELSPEGEKDVITPIITFIGSALPDNRTIAGNGLDEEAVLVQPGESREIKLRYDADVSINVAKIATSCNRIVFALRLNGAELYKVEMKKDSAGIWEEEK